MTQKPNKSKESSRDEKKKNSKISKLKKALQKLKLFRSEIKAEEKKIDKKLKNADKLKKKEIKALQEKKAESSKKKKKISKNLANKKDKLKKEKKKLEQGYQKAAKNKTVPDVKKQEPENNDMTYKTGGDSIQINDEKRTENPEIGRTALNNSIDFNTREAIAYVRKLPTIIEVENYVKKDKRKTVKNVASSRINAIKRKSEK